MLPEPFIEDGFADVCDGLGGGWTKEKILLIMKDSRLGTYGAAGLILILAIKFTSLREIPSYFIPLALISGHSLSRFIATTLIYTHSYVRDTDDSKAKPAAKNITINMLIVSGIFGLLPLFFFKTPWVFLTIIPCYLVKVYMGGKFKKWLGGQTGDCAGAVQQLCEVVFLLKSFSLMEIYLVRHTTPAIDKGICYGQTDLDLAENYIEEFKTLAAKLPDTANYKVISSPLKRCAILAQYLGKEVHYDNRLKELDFGDWEMKSWNKIPEETLNPWMKDFVNVKVPKGESYIDLASRVGAFFEELRASQNNQNILIVTHGGPIRFILATLLGIPLEKSFRIKINYGDIFQVKKEGNQFKLISKKKSFQLKLAFLFLIRLQIILSTAALLLFP